MNAKQSELSGGDNPAEQDVLSDPVDFRPPTVPMKTPLNGNITTPNYSAPIDLGPVSGSQNPAIEGSNTQHQEGNVLSLSGDLHQDVQHTPRYDIGTAGVSEGHSQDFSLDRPIDPFVSNSTDASPRRTIELQSNNPFRAKLEQCQSDATPIASSPFPAPQNVASSEQHRPVSLPSPGSGNTNLAFRPLSSQQVPREDNSTMSHEASISPKTSVVQVTDVDQDRHGSNQFRSPSNIQPQPQTTVPQQDLINFDDTANAGRQSNLPHLPSAPDTYRTNDLAGLNHDFSAIKLDAPHDTEGQQAKPQDATAVRTIPQEQPSEIYGIRVVNWMDGIHKSLRQSPILVQNLNGPCPLLALVNSLVLRTPSDVQSPLIKALNSRERISLGLLIQTLFDELTTYVNEEHQLPDIEDLSAFLTMLHTGMNVNPRLTPDMDPPRPGMFHQTRDIKLYSAFNLPLVHGWLASPVSETYEAMTRVAEYHDDIQLLHFRKEELEDRVISGGVLSPEEELLVKDIDHIQRFVNVENATQLSSFGLDHLNRSLQPGAICILFRNDHFSTLFKHPQSHQLFTLVTDAGYANHAEIVWESLVDVNGSGSELFSGDFRPVGNAPSGPPPQRRDQQVVPNQNTDSSQPSKHDEQSDADYAYALALQFQDEEEERTRTNPRTTGRPQYPPNWQPVTTRPHGRSSSNATPQSRRQQSTTGHRQSRQSQVVRSLVSPAHDTPIRQTLSADANLPPPTYEQAARTPPYNPEEQPNVQYDGTTSIAGPRSSSYSYGSGSGRTPPRQMHHPPGRRPEPIMTHGRQREKEKGKDCVVM